MKDRFHEEPRLTRRDLINELKVLAAGAIGAFVGKTIDDAQYANERERLATVEVQLKALQTQTALDRQQQQGVNTILVNRVYQIGEQMQKK